MDENSKQGGIAARVQRTLADEYAALVDSDTLAITDEQIAEVLCQAANEQEQDALDLVRGRGDECELSDLGESPALLSQMLAQLGTGADDRLTLAEVEARLDALGCEPRRSPSSGSIYARCPLHDDRDPSLSVAEGAHGSILAMCHRCDLDGNRPAWLAAFFTKLRTLNTATLATVQAQTLSRPPARRYQRIRPVCAYIYLGWDRRPVARLLRRETVDENGELGRSLIWQRPLPFLDGSDSYSWIPGLDGVERPIRLWLGGQVSDQIEREGTDSVVWLTEGESDAVALNLAGYPATCAPGGAGKFRSEHAEALKGAGQVVVIADHDAAGLPDGLHRAKLVGEVIGSDRVRLVRPPTPGTDVRDLLDGGGAVDDLEEYGPGDLNADGVEMVSTNEPASPVDMFGGLDVVTVADVQVSRVLYVWERRIPRGAMTLMPGEEGIGKTTVGIRLIADLTRGLLPGEYLGTARDAVILATEDGLADVVAPRLREAGADLSRVHVVRARFGADGGPEDVILPDDLDLVRAVVEHYEAAIVWVDSLVTTLPDEMKSISYKDTAKVLRKLGSWAERHRVAVVAPWHLNKSAGSDTALRIMDSRAFRTAVRSMLLVVADPEAPEGRTGGIVALDKANAGTLHVPALRYVIRSADYIVAEQDPDSGAVLDRLASCGVVEWTGEVSGDGREMARELLAPRIDREDPTGDWLRDLLSEVGEMPRPAVVEQGKAAGFSLSAIKRAAARIGVHSRDEAGQYPETNVPYRRAIWSLDSPPPVGSLHGLVEPNEPTGGDTT